MKHVFDYSFPIGRIFIAELDGMITDVALRSIGGADKKETPVISLAVKMLWEYFDGKRKSFDGLPFLLEGTDFQKRAWTALQSIPYGQTRTYKEQAEAIGNKKACRAVGAANGKNPISIIIPCHRVIGSDKSLTGYAGGLDAKKALLELEKKYSR